MTVKWSDKGQGQAEIKPSQMSGFISQQLRGLDAAHHRAPLFIGPVKLWTSLGKDHKVFRHLKAIGG